MRTESNSFLKALGTGYQPVRDHHLGWSLPPGGRPPGLWPTKGCPSGEKQGCQEGLHIRGATPAKAGGGLWHRHTHHPARHVSITAAATLEIVVPLQRTSCMAWGYQREWMLGRLCVGSPYHAQPWPLGHTLYGDPAVPLMTGHCKAWDQGAGLPAMRPMRWLPPGHWDKLTPDHGKVKVGAWAGKGWAEREWGRAEQCGPH